MEIKPEIKWKNTPFLTNAALFMKTLLCVWVVQGNALQFVEMDYNSDYFLFKHLFAILGKINGWGMEAVFFFFGILCVNYLADRTEVKKNRCLKALCILFAAGTVIGRSYYEVHSWHFIWPGKMQFALALLVGCGYYCLYHNLIAFGYYLIVSRSLLAPVQSRNKLEYFLFEKHPFGGPFLVIMSVSLPYIVLFFPGTLHWDALGQLWAFLGRIEWNGIHPLFNSWLMGQCLLIGRNLFHSDNIGMFLYTFPQYVAQWLVFSYGIYLMSKMKSPLLLRWGCLAYFTVFPLWKMWGYTMAKDTWYYIWMLLLVLLLIDGGMKEYRKMSIWQWMLLAATPPEHAFPKETEFLCLPLHCYVPRCYGIKNGICICYVF